MAKKFEYDCFKNLPQLSKIILITAFQKLKKQSVTKIESIINNWLTLNNDQLDSLAEMSRDLAQISIAALVIEPIVYRQPKCYVVLIGSLFYVSFGILNLGIIKYKKDNV